MLTRSEGSDTHYFGSTVTTLKRVDTWMVWCRDDSRQSAALHPAAGLVYDGRVSGQTVPGGVVHEMPADLREALLAHTTALAAWNDITPLARNEFICWVDDAKQETTRARRIRRTQEELEEGQRRPCCWPGCRHRERNGR